MKKLINLFLFAAIAGTSLQSCAKTCYGTNAAGQTVEVPCNSNGSNAVYPATKVWKLWGDVLTAYKAYSLDDYGCILNIPNDGNMHAGEPDNNFMYIKVVDPDGFQRNAMITRDDFNTLKGIVGTQKIGDFWKSKSTQKEFYFSSSFTDKPVGCTQMGPANQAVGAIYNDGFTHYTHGGDPIAYRVDGITFQ